MKRCATVLFYLLFILAILSPGIIHADTNGTPSDDNDSSAPEYQSVKQELPLCKELQPNASYICGDFCSERTFSLGKFDAIQMKITNLDTQLDYQLYFNTKHKYNYYQLAPGRYQITAIEFHNTIRTTTKRWIFFKTNITKTIHDYPVDPAMLRQFELKPGECLYIGNYTAKIAYGWFRTAQIYLTNNSEGQKADFQNMNATTQLAFRSLDIPEINPPSFTDRSKSEKADSVIAVRLGANRGDFKLVIVDITHKKYIRVKFSNKSPIQYVKVAPGEYLVESIYFGGSFRYDPGNYPNVIPKELFWPFAVGEKELLYLGRFDLDVGNGKFDTEYMNDFGTDKKEIEKIYDPGQYDIKTLNQ